MLDPTDLRDQYRLAVEEYRFQVNLNWQRSQYYFVLNVGVLVAGTSLLAASATIPRGLIAAIFAVGALLAILSIFANATGHTYYRSTRDLKERLEEELKLGEFAVTTTSGMGSLRRRIGKVKTLLTIMLLALAAADIGGVAVSLAKALEGRPVSPAELFVRVRVPRLRTVGAELPLVLSSRNRPVISTTVAADRLVRLEVRPGVYQLSSYTRAPCQTSVRVTRAPLRVVDLSC